jgi:hypothetical protein
MIAVGGALTRLPPAITLDPFGVMAFSFDSSYSPRYCSVSESARAAWPAVNSNMQES